MSKDVAFPAEKAHVKEFTHPNGQTGILIALSMEQGAISDAYNLPAPPEPDSPAVMPLKHKADGATNFQSYREEDDEIIVTHTDEQYGLVRRNLAHMLGVDFDG